MANVIVSDLDELIRELQDWRFRYGNERVGLENPFTNLPSRVEVLPVHIPGVGRIILLKAAPEI